MRSTIGVKLTHDAAVAVFDGNDLLFSIEAEKLNNNPRYSKFKDFPAALDVLRMENFHDIEAVFCFDGWKNGRISHMPAMRVSPYHEWDGFEPTVFPSLHREGQYNSYSHIAGHVMGSYMMSPFALDKQVAFVCVADGGVNPRVWRVDPVTGDVNYVGSANYIYGKIYSIAGYYFGPWRDDSIHKADIYDAEKNFFGQYDWPGKLMSWMAKGHSKYLDVSFPDMDSYYQDLINRFPVSDNRYHADGVIEHLLCRYLQDSCNPTGEDEEASCFLFLHNWLCEKLVEGLNVLVPNRANLVFTGGSALNIKWNSELRRQREGKIWVPPVANDTGSAIGAACCHLWFEDHYRHINWNVFSGPNLKPKGERSGWVGTDVPLYKCLLAGEVVMRLCGRSEIGPRALGHRSLLALATDPALKDRLNTMKGREAWRPVAPIVSDAGRKFFRNAPDEYMLFDNVLTSSWNDGKPSAIDHIDGTARAQLCNADLDKELFLTIEECGGVLCNTSANLNGSGFFGDFDSASEWAEKVGVKHIQYQGTMWRFEK